MRSSPHFSMHLCIIYQLSTNNPQNTVYSADVYKYLWISINIFECIYAAWTGVLSGKVRFDWHCARPMFYVFWKRCLPYTWALEPSGSRLSLEATTNRRATTSDVSRYIRAAGQRGSHVGNPTQRNPQPTLAPTCGPAWWVTQQKRLLSWVVGVGELAKRARFEQGACQQNRQPPAHPRPLQHTLKPKS